MAMTRVKYGIEYSIRTEPERHSSSGVSWIVILVLLIATASFVVHRVRRLNTPSEVVEAVQDESNESVAQTTAPSSPSEEQKERDNLVREEVHPLVVNDFTERSPKARNLLLRLEETARQGDLAAQVSTIEQLRALPGDAVADIDDSLVLQLGTLNFRWLFELKNPQWVVDVTVKSGDVPSRIANESGSTLGSLKKLNPDVNFDRLRIGTKLKVLNHPSFTLIVRKKLRTVDLNLNGKLFKRYSLPDGTEEITMEPGGYRTPANLREYFNRHTIRLTPADVEELDLLIPRNTPLRVSPL